MRTAIFRSLWVATLLGGGAALFSQSPNYLHTQGSSIMDSRGSVVRITGLNWFGLETGNYCPHGLWSHSMAFYLDLVKAQGYNTLRLPYCSQLFDGGSTPSGIDYSQNPDLVNLTGIQIMDKVIAGCRSRGLKVILDRHRPDSGSQSALWYTGTYSEARWISDWTMLAQRYKGNDTVIGCDLHNEPHGPATWGDGTSNDWALAAQRCGDAILQVNPALLIFVEGSDSFGGATYWWGGQLAGAAAHPVNLCVPNQLVYSTHDYPASVYSQSWFSDPAYPSNLPGVWDRTWGYLVKNHTAPVLVGEFGSRLEGDSDRKWFGALASYIKANGISFTFWCLNPNSGDTGGLLQDDWTTVVQAKQQVLAPLQAPLIGGVSAEPPASPTCPEAKPGDSQVWLTWRPSPGAETYSLYRGTAPGAEDEVPVTTGIRSHAFLQTGLVNGTTYYYRIAAVNAAGQSVPTPEIHATPTDFGPGPLTATPKVASLGPWWGQIDVDTQSTVPIGVMHLNVSVQMTPGLTYAGTFNTAGSQEIVPSHSELAHTLVYNFHLAPLRKLTPGNLTFAAQFATTGTLHPTAGDTYTLHYVVGGKSYLLTGHF